MKFHIWVFLENLSRKFKSLQNLTRITDTLHEDLSTFMIISRSIFLRTRNVSKKVVEKIKTHILCSVSFSRKWCLLCDNVENYSTARQVTDDNIILFMRFACWITKATDTHSEYVILIAFHTATMVTWTRLNVTLYVHPLSCFTLILFKLLFDLIFFLTSNSIRITSWKTLPYRDRCIVLSDALYLGTYVPTFRATFRLKIEP
jgi:hypothetical protein